MRKNANHGVYYDGFLVLQILFQRYRNTVSVYLFFFFDFNKGTLFFSVSAFKRDVPLSRFRFWCTQSSGCFSYCYNKCCLNVRIFYFCNFCTVSSAYIACSTTQVDNIRRRTTIVHCVVVIVTVVIIAVVVATVRILVRTIRPANRLHSVAYYRNPLVA